MKNLYRSLLSSVVFSVLLMSCDLSYLDKEIDDFKIDGGIATAIGRLNYSPADLFDDATSDDFIAETNDEGIITVIYQNQLKGESYVEFYEFENQDFNGGFDHGLDMPVSSPVANQVQFSDAVNLVFDNGDKADVELESAVFKEGDLVLNVTSTLSEDILITVSIPSFTNKQTGERFSVETTLNGSNPSINLTEALSQFDVDFTKDKDGGSTYNNIVLEVSGLINIEVGSRITSADELSYSVQMTGIDYERVYGDFKQHPFDISSDLVEIDFFNDFQSSGESYFDNPKITVDFENSFGVPMSVDINRIYAEAHDGSQMNLSGDVLSQSQIITAPTLQEVGLVSNSSMLIDRDNSNLNELISSRPRQFFFEIDAITNPLSIPYQDNFILDTSTLLANVKVELPFEIRFQNIILENELDFNPIESEYDAEDLNIVVNTDNEMPLSGNLTLVFVDENERVLHTEIIDEAFDAAAVGDDGLSNASVNKKTIIPFDELNFDKIQGSEKIKTYVTFNSFDSENGSIVKLQADDRLQINIAIDANASYNSGN